MDRRWGLLGVVLTLCAWGCWQAMETVPDYSPASTMLFYGGYILVAIALFAFYKTFRSPQT